MLIELDSSNEETSVARPSHGNAQESEEDDSEGSFEYYRETTPAADPNTM